LTRLSAAPWRSAPLLSVSGFRETDSVFDVGSRLSDLGFQDSSSPADCTESAKSGDVATAFVPYISPDQKLGVSFYHVDVKDDEEPDSALTGWNSCFVHSDRRFLIQSPADFSQASKEALLSLLELAEELGSETAWMIISRSLPNFREMAKIYSYIGFQLVASEKVNSPHVLMRYSLQ